MWSSENKGNKIKTPQLGKDFFLHFLAPLHFLLGQSSQSLSVSNRLHGTVTFDNLKTLLLLYADKENSYLLIFKNCVIRFCNQKC